MNSLKEALSRIINNYDTDIKEYLYGDNFDMSNYNLNPLSLPDSIDYIVKQSLKRCKHTKENEKYVVVGDVHGNLKSFARCLYAANVIDDNGNWSGNDRILIQLGDVIDRGKFSWQSVLYLKTLQQQARLTNGNVIRILGNHEHTLLVGMSRDTGPSLCNENFLRRILREDILQNDILLTYADNDLNILFSHAGLEKKMLLYILCKLGFEQDIFTLKQNPFNLSESGELKSGLIYNFMKSKNLDIEKISAFLNLTLEKDTSLNKLTANPLYMPYSYNYLQDVSGIFWTRKKSEKFIQGLLPYRPLSQKKHKPIQVVGHTVSEYITSIDFRVPPGNIIKRINRTIFADVGLFLGVEAFLSIGKEGQIKEVYKGLLRWFTKIIHQPLYESQGCFEGLLNTFFTRHDLPIKINKDIRTNITNRINETNEIPDTTEYEESTIIQTTISEHNSFPPEQENTTPIVEHPRKTHKYKRTEGSIYARNLSKRILRKNSAFNNKRNSPFGGNSDTIQSFDIIIQRRTTAYSSLDW